MAFCNHSSLILWVASAAVNGLSLAISCAKLAETPLVTDDMEGVRDDIEGVRSGCFGLYFSSGSFCVFGVWVDINIKGVV